MVFCEAVFVVHVKEDVAGVAESVAIVSVGRALDLAISTRATLSNSNNKMRIKEWRCIFTLLPSLTMCTSPFSQRHHKLNKKFLVTNLHLIDIAI